MKYVVVILVLFFGKTSFGQWSISQRDTTTTFGSVYFINSEIGWISGYHGILHTTDEGKTWVNQSGYSIRKFFFLDKNIGWAAGSDGYYTGLVLHTTNGGTDWTVQYYSSNETLTSVFFTSIDTGWAVVHFGPLYQTTNGGKNWTFVHIPNYDSPSFNSIFFINHNDGFLVGFDCILKTTNAGVSWNDKATVVGNHEQIIFTDSANGWIMGGETLHTTDKGKHWVEQKRDKGDTLLSIFFTDSKNGWISGGSYLKPNFYSGKILHTTNGGDTWVNQFLPTKDILWDVCFSDINSGWAVGENGVIIHTTNGGLGVNANNPNSEKSLLKNYPNPLNSTTTFNYNIPKTSFVTLRIMNALGEEVSRLVSQVESEGIHEAKWDAHDMPNGIYFCELKAGEYSQSVRVIVAK